MTSRSRRIALVLVPVLSAIVVVAYVYGIFPRFFVPARLHVAEDITSGGKALVAIATLAFVAWTAHRRALRRPLAKRFERPVLGVLAVLGVVGYFGFGDVGYVRGYHRWEFFHYYLGAKYQNAIRYDAIYAATAVAQAELSPAHRAEVEGRVIRNLSLDQLVPATLALGDAASLKGRFSSAEQWEDFKRDIAWFRSSAQDVKWWSDMQKDHGFNASPVWMMLGQPLTKIGSASDLTLRLLSSIDLFIFAALFGAIAWAFGARTGLLALVFWGTQWPFDKAFTFGAFLRQDWLLLLVLAACFARKRWYAAAGFAFAWSTLLRLFPAVFVLPIAVAALARFRRVKDLRHRDLRPFRRFVVAAAITTAVIGTTSVVWFGVPTWKEFVGRIESHANAQSTNVMGLKSIVAFSWNTRTDMVASRGTADDLARWREYRADHIAERKGWYNLGALAFVAVSIASATRRRRPIWVLFGLGVPLVVGLSELSNYYYSFFLLLPLLGRLGARFEILAFTTAAFSSALMVWPRLSQQYDTRCYFQSWLFLLASVAMVFALGLRRPTRGRAPSAAPRG